MNNGYEDLKHDKKKFLHSSLSTLDDKKVVVFYSWTSSISLFLNFLCSIQNDICTHDIENQLNDNSWQLTRDNSVTFKCRESRREQQVVICFALVTLTVFLVVDNRVFFTTTNFMFSSCSAWRKCWRHMVIPSSFIEEAIAMLNILIFGISSYNPSLIIKKISNQTNH